MKYIKLFEEMDYEIDDWEEEPEDKYPNYPKDFKQFLIDNDALEEFDEYIKSKTSFFKHIPKLWWISSAFSWSIFNNQSKWSNLNNKWIKIVNTELN